MVASESSENESGWLRVPPTDAAEITQRYDDWAETYDRELVGEWRYDAPQVAAAILHKLLLPRLQPDNSSSTGPVLDLGCGTGLTGLALSEVGFEHIDGLDLSEASLQLAKNRSVYRTLTAHDFNAAPVPAPNDSYAAAICVGVLSYAQDPLAVIGDLIRVVQAGGTIVFTHRTDLWDAQHLDVGLTDLQNGKQVQNVSWTEPQEYMPGNPGYADLRIRYVNITVAQVG